MKNKTFVALATALMTLVICFVLFPSTAKAYTISESEISKTYTYNINSSNRTLYVLKNGCISYSVGSDGPVLLSYFASETGFDKYGTVWLLMENTIYWWNYDLAGGFNDFSGILYRVPKPNSSDPTAGVDNVESLIFETSGNQEFVVGYKTLSGESYPILTFEQMKNYPNISYNPDPLTPSNPTPNPVTPPAPTSPSNVQTQSPATPNTPVVTPDVPTVSAEPVVTPKVSNKVSIKKSGLTTSIYEGDTVVSKLELKKGTLIWKGTTKSGKYKNVKSAGYIKKSKNFAFITKKGVAYIVSSKTGKKMRIVKKGAKKLVLSGKYVTKIKTKSGSVNVSNK